MKKPFFIIIMSLMFQLSALPIDTAIEYPSACTECHEWAIIGAGFAGITALAVLIESGVDPSTIAWIDPEFNVGRVGKYYRDVPGNITTNHLKYYVNNCPYFKEINSPFLCSLYTYAANEFQPLHVIVDPLTDFTTCLQNKVIPIQKTIDSLTRINNYWAMKSSDDTIVNAKKVILAIGAHPKKLNYDIAEIPLDDAFDKNKLAHAVTPNDSIAVFGGMHSAILILKFLSECSVKQIVNFYSEKHFYGSPGLEGATAIWAKNVLDNNPPANLIRVVNTQENRDHLLSTCTKAIYAIGYESNSIIVNGTSDVTFDEHTGIIDQDLYGIGIAFPPTGIFNGKKISKNGLYAYLVYAKKLIPHWINNDKSQLLVKDTDQEIPWI